MSALYDLICALPEGQTFVVHRVDGQTWTLMIHGGGANLGADLRIDRSLLAEPHPYLFAREVDATAAALLRHPGFVGVPA